MSMHLHHPSLSLAGKSKGKRKFRNAAEAKKARELEASWNELQSKWSSLSVAKPARKSNSSEVLTQYLAVPAERSTRHIPSRDTGPAVAAKVESPVYTGTKVKGIAQMAKSNAVPVFNNDQIIEVARMRR